MRWFWQEKKPTTILQKVSDTLPEYIFYEGRTWGLRLKKENGYWATRYVTRNEPNRRGYDSISARKSVSIKKSMKNMIKYLNDNDLMKNAVAKPVYTKY